MVTVPTSTIDKISQLSEGQLNIITALIEELIKKNNTDIDVSKRIGVAKGKVAVSQEFNQKTIFKI
ncbi:MAG: hypothetical protein IJV15_04895 [Lachnospiraceae bacterium]|nr:hypothetical protein [Lachnospiraceae bacterium]